MAPIRLVTAGIATVLIVVAAPPATATLGAMSCASGPFSASIVPDPAASAWWSWDFWPPIGYASSGEYTVRGGNLCALAREDSGASVFPFHGSNRGTWYGTCELLALEFGSGVAYLVGGSTLVGHATAGGWNVDIAAVIVESDGVPCPFTRMAGPTSFSVWGDA